MRRFVPRAMLAAALVASAAGCATGGGAGVALGGDTGGRYLVMIPDLQGQGGDRVANELRALVTGMATHAAISGRDIRTKMSEYDLEALDEISSRQLATLINAQLVTWGSVAPGGSGLQAEVKVVDTRSGDEFTIAGSGATPPELAGSLFADLDQKIEGIRQAAFCNDYLSSNQYDRALETCEAALAIVPTSSTGLYGKATALLYLERVEEALRIYQQLLDADPTNQDALLGAGLAASRLGRSQDAMAFYNRYMEINPGNVQVRMTIANDAAQAGDYLSAFRVLEGGIADNRDNGDFQRYLFSIATAAGQRLMEAGDSATARPILMAALDAYRAGFSNGEAPEPAQIRNVIAVNNLLGRTDEAIQMAREGTQRFGDDAQMWSQYAQVLSSAGRHQDAHDALTRLIELNPQHENAHIRRAQALLQLGQRDRAMADLRVAAERGDRQTVATVLAGLGTEALRAENFAEAESTLSSAREFATGTLRSDISYYISVAVYRQAERIAQANQATGNPDQAQRALTLFRRALQLAEESQNSGAGQIRSASQQYIENQEAIIRAARGG